MKRLLLWDFDGVICHSLDECLLTSYNAFRQYREDDEPLITSLADVTDDLRGFFYRTRQHVRRPGEYLILYEAFGQERSLDDYSQFGKLLSEHIRDIEDYEGVFFKARERLRKNDISEWLALHHGYPWVNEKWEALKETFQYYIVSNKDKESILLILKHLGLGISQKTIFGKEFSMNKAAIIKYILSIGHNSKEKVYLVDDHFGHLMDVAPLGIRLFFATWGYGKPMTSDDTGVVFLQKDMFDRQLLEGIYE